MRSPFLSTLVLLACSGMTAAAHADTFNPAITPTGVATMYQVNSTATLDNVEYAPYELDLLIALQFSFFGPFSGGTTTATNLPNFGMVNGAVSTTPAVTDLQTTAATPEPSSLILLGTGLMGVAGMARRRFFTV